MLTLSESYSVIRFSYILLKSISALLKVSAAANIRGTYKGNKLISVKQVQRAIAGKAIVITVDELHTSEENDRGNWRYVSRRHTEALEEIIKWPEVEEIDKGDPVHFNIRLQIDHIGATVIVERKNRFINRKIKEITNGEKPS
ncbi:hypothetical protein MFLAVUS_010001 [Mucor flavus]|uniref:Uncharacterized protein n=1 Tax=Mucor flavus TaxID=439312 RepID=A0ABP9ZBG9_9FUNG